MNNKHIYRAGKNYRPEPIQDSTFYFFKGYLIRVSNDGKDIWLYNRTDYMSNHSGEKALERGMEEVYKKIEDSDKKAEEQAKELAISNHARQQLEPYLDVIIKELTKLNKLKQNS